MVRVTSSTGYLYTGINEIDTELSGGITMGSLVFMEGNAKTGKSILCHYLAYNALRLDGRSVAYYTSRNTVRGLLDKMKSLSLPVLDNFLTDTLRIFPVAVPKGPDATQDFIRRLTDHIMSLPDRFGMVIVDSITSVMSDLSPEKTMDFLYICKEMCNENRSMVLVADSYGFKKGILLKVNMMSDAFLRFRSEYRRLNPQLVDNRLIRIMNVEKLNGIERQPRDGVMFEIESSHGIRILPISLTSA